MKQGHKHAVNFTKKEEYSLQKDQITRGFFFIKVTTGTGMKNLNNLTEINTRY
jgi:hypothetical protein